MNVTDIFMSNNGRPAASASLAASKANEPGATTTAVDDRSGPAFDRSEPAGGRVLTEVGREREGVTESA